MRWIKTNQDTILAILIWVTCSLTYAYLLYHVLMCITKAIFEEGDIQIGAFAILYTFCFGLTITKLIEKIDEWLNG